MEKSKLDLAFVCDCTSARLGMVTLFAEEHFHKMIIPPKVHSYSALMIFALNNRQFYEIG